MGTREELSNTLGELRGVLDRSLDWRDWVRARPWAVLGVAALIGWRLGRGRWL
jgi:hypothetical protein